MELRIISEILNIHDTMKYSQRTGSGCLVVLSFAATFFPYAGFCFFLFANSLSSSRFGIDTSSSSLFLFTPDSVSFTLGDRLVLIIVAAFISFPLAFLPNEGFIFALSSSSSVEYKSSQFGTSSSESSGGASKVSSRFGGGILKTFTGL